jgi:hypothetical protein
LTHHKTSNTFFATFILPHRLLLICLRLAQPTEIFTLFCPLVETLRRPATMDRTPQVLQQDLGLPLSFRSQKGPFGPRTLKDFWQKVRPDICPDAYLKFWKL